MTDRPARRRLPISVLGAAGALVALAAGVGIEKMRWGPPLVMVALGGMTLALTAAALWRVLDPLTRVEEPKQAGVPGAAGRGRLRELEREKQLVLKAIKEIELDYQMKKVAEREYREMVERYRGRALRLISEIDAGDDFRGLIERELKMRLELPVAEPSKAPDATATAAVATGASPALGCPSCQTVNDADAQFCKKCGAKILS